MAPALPVSISPIRQAIDLGRLRATDVVRCGNMGVSSCGVARLCILIRSPRDSGRWNCRRSMRLCRLTYIVQARIIPILSGIRFYILKSISNMFHPFDCLPAGSGDVKNPDISECHCRGNSKPQTLDGARQPLASAYPCLRGLRQRISAFVAGLAFTTAGIVNMDQIPLTTNVPGNGGSVPEPSILGLMGIGLLGLGLAGRRRREAS
ncbi:MAG TPA: PEP-CTERM sorting domain-containing protein [Gammaproteobacteria bacterium]|nr:PEP-CTERM sorting domain-containing protein [Gammaproteobacteria bacterium]